MERMLIREFTHSNERNSLLNIFLDNFEDVFSRCMPRGKAKEDYLRTIYLQ